MSWRAIARCANSLLLDPPAPRNAPPRARAHTPPLISSDSSDLAVATLDTILFFTFQHFQHLVIIIIAKHAYDCGSEFQVRVFAFDSRSGTRSPPLPGWRPLEAQTLCGWSDSGD